MIIVSIITLLFLAGLVLHFVFDRPRVWITIAERDKEAKPCK